MFLSGLWWRGLLREVGCLTGAFNGANRGDYTGRLKQAETGKRDGHQRETRQQDGEDGASALSLPDPLRRAI
jgi:hypothetical protein